MIPAGKQYVVLDWRAYAMLKQTRDLIVALPWYPVTDNAHPRRAPVIVVPAQSVQKLDLDMPSFIHDYGFIDPVLGEQIPQDCKRVSEHAFYAI